MNTNLKNATKAIALATALALSVPTYAATDIDSVTAFANAVTIHGANFIKKKGRLQVFLSGYTAP